MIGTMSTDIWGFIECRRDYRENDEETFWHATIDLDHLKVPRDYDAFGCLFGVCDNEQFAPVAPVRGMPADASNRALTGYGSTGVSASWVTWAEIERVDWEEESADPHPSVREYERGPQGDWRLLGRYHHAPRRFVELSGLPSHAVERAGEHFAGGGQWIDGDRMFRVGRVSRREAVPDERWGPIWTVMRTLADLHGDDDVRLVVWFDS